MRRRRLGGGSDIKVGDVTILEETPPGRGSSRNKVSVPRGGERKPEAWSCRCGLIGNPTMDVGVVFLLL